MADAAPVKKFMSACSGVVSGNRHPQIDDHAEEKLHDKEQAGSQVGDQRPLDALDRGPAEQRRRTSRCRSHAGAGRWPG